MRRGVTLRRLWASGVGVLALACTATVAAGSATPPDRPNTCAVYPIAVAASSLHGVAAGDVVADVLNGGGPGNGGWLTWAGGRSETALAGSLTPPGDSASYVDPDDPSDTVLSRGDRVAGAPGAMNGRAVRDALEALRGVPIVVPVWSEAEGGGAGMRYVVERFARIGITGFDLAHGRVAARFLGFAACENRPPVAEPASAVTDEDTPVDVPLVATDPDSDPVTLALARPPAHGTATLAGSTATYVPDPDFNGADSFSFTADDGTDVSEPAEVTIEVRPVNDAPVAVDGSVETDEDTPVPVSFTAVDVDGDVLTFTAGAPANGTFDGATYAPNADFHGTDAIPFTVDDGNGGTDAGVVTVLVLPANDPPTAGDDSAAVDEDSSVVVPVLANDFDVDGDALRILSVSPPAHGAVVILGFGGTEILYVPDADYFGPDAFAYTAADPSGATDTAAVDVLVRPVNDAPRAADVSVATDEDVPVAVPFAGTDVDGDALSFRVVGPPAHGSVAAGVYTPDADFSGADSFTYVASDGALDSNVATVAVEVWPVNDPPVARDVSASGVEDEPVDGSFDASDPDGDALTFAAVDVPAGASVEITGASFRLHPPADFFGELVFGYRASDGSLASSTALVRVTLAPANDAPVARPDALATDEDVPATLDAAANDEDVDGDALAVSAVGAPANGAAELLPSGEIRYTPDADFNGADAFDYTVVDPSGAAATGTVSVTVRPVNDAPTAADVSAATDEDVPLAVPFAGADVDGDALSYSVVAPPANGSVAGGVYTPDADFTGADSFTYVASDGALGSNVATVTVEVRPVNDAPAAMGYAAETDEDVAVPLALPAGDVDGDPLTLEVIGLPANGSYAGGVYTPSPDFNGTDSLTFRATDPSGAFDEATIGITVRPVNDAPVAADDDYVVPQDGSRTIDAPGVLANDTDVDGGALQALLAAGPAHGSLTLNADGSFTYAPDAGYAGPDAFTYRASDGALDSAIATVTITVRAPALETVEVTPADAEIAPDTTLQYTATGRYDDGTTRDLTALAAWTSSDEGVATIDAAGLATAEGAGTTTIGAAFSGVSGSTSLTVSDSAIVELVLEPEQLHLGLPAPGGASPLPLTGQLRAIGVHHDGTDEDASSLVEWSSANESVATVSAAGLVTAEGAGTTQVTATLGELAASGPVDVVQAAAPGTPPTATITAPAEGASLGGPASVVGTASSAQLFRWRLELRPDGEPAWTELATGDVNVTAGTLGQVDPTLLLNGIYEVRLSVTDRAGQTATALRTVVVERDQKVGLFTLSFTDLSVPVGGLPIQVIRTYDSRDKRTGDFGVGWSLDVKSLQIDENRAAGADWNGTRSGGFFPQYCIVQAQAHVVSITLPDGRVERFQPVWNPPCQSVIPQTFVSLSFTPMAGTLGTLVALDGADGLVQGSFPGAMTIVDLDTFEPADPDLYRYTSPAGDQITLTEQGVQSVRDRNGNTLTFSSSGITHSSGAGVAFTRDAQGRITQITDPRGGVLRYAYNGTGDLVSFRDQVDNETRFTYNRSHGLIDLIDPLGRRGVRNVYDEDGRLTAVIDAAGNRTEIGHDLAARRNVVTDRLGNTTVFEYDASGNVTREVDATGNPTTYTYDAGGNKLTETNALGQATSFTYDARGNLLTQRNALGQTLTMTYNPSGDPLTVRDPLGNTSTFTYDANGNVLTLADPAGSSTYTYDARGNAQTARDPSGAVTGFTYDANGRPTTATDALGNSESYAYDASGNITSITRGTRVETFEYDAANRLVRHVDGAGGVRLTTYTPTGKVATETDPVGNVTSYEYDDLDRLAATVFPDGFRETYEYDAEGRRTKLVARGGTTLYEYDAAGRPTKTTFPDGSTRLQAYDAAGRLVSETDELGAVTAYEYDAAGRRTKATDPLGGETTSTYDAAGRLVGSEDRIGRVTAYTYDAAGRLTRTDYPDGTSTSSTYDALGRKLTDTDRGGNVTTFTYDVLGRLTSVRDPLGGITAYAYDRFGNRTRITDAAGRVTDFEYDGADRLTRRTLPLGMSESRTYDPAGRLTATVDFNGTRIEYLYDALGRIARKDFSGTSVTYHYGANGLVSRIDDARGSMSFAYDARGRPLSVADPGGGTVAYTYDQAGNRLSVDAGGGAVTYAYDAARRMTGATDAGGATSFAYDAEGQLTQLTLPNGVVGRYTYAASGLPTQIAYELGGSPVQTFAYGYDANGRRTSVTDATGTTAYAYDAAGRLVDEGGTASTYDAAGNRLTRGGASYTYDANGRLTSDGTAAYGYDANGNVVSKTDAAGTQTFEYDALGRLVRTTAPGGAATSFDYDALGNLVERGDAAGTTYLFVDPFAPGRGGSTLPQTLREVTGGVETRHAYAGDRLLSTGGAYALEDATRSIRALTDGAGAVTDTYAYDAWGNLASSTGSSPNPYGFTGQRFDDALGAHYLRARWYDPGTGRFLSLDPESGVATDPRTLNPYAYALNDPLNLYDPSGRFFASFSFAITNIWARTVWAMSLPLYTLAHIINRLSVTIGAANLRAYATSFSQGVYRLLGGNPRLLNMHAGQVLEKLVNPIMRLLGARAQVAVQGGAARVDWLWNGILVDTKLGGYFSRGQFLHYVAEARLLAGQINYITLRAPPGSVVAEFQQIAAQNGVVVKFFTILPF